MRIRIQLLIEVMRICTHWSTEPPELYFELQASTVSVHAPQRHYFELLKLLNIYFNADLDPAFL